MYRVIHVVYIVCIILIVINDNGCNGKKRKKRRRARKNMGGGPGQQFDPDMMRKMGGRGGRNPMGNEGMEGMMNGGNQMPGGIIYHQLPLQIIVNMKMLLLMNSPSLLLVLYICMYRF